MISFERHFWTAAALIGLLALAAGCSPRYTIRSYPEGATVYIKDVVGPEKKLVGQTPLSVKRTKEMGDVFFLVLEKENFMSKQVLMTPKDGDNLTVAVSMDPIQDKSGGALAEKKDEKDGGSKDGSDSPQRGPASLPDDKKKTEEMIRDLNMRIALLENTVALQKDALFSGRYASGGPASFDRDRTDTIVDHLFKSQQMVVGKKYDNALEELDKALALDEYLPQAYLIKGSIFYVKKQYEKAKIAWERCLKIDPYNAQAYNYLRLVNKRLGKAMPPEKPSYLRAPASDEFSRSLRQ